MSSTVCMAFDKLEQGRSPTFIHYRSCTRLYSLGLVFRRGSACHNCSKAGSARVLRYCLTIMTNTCLPLLVQKAVIMRRPRVYDTEFLCGVVRERAIKRHMRVKASPRRGVRHDNWTTSTLCDGLFDWVCEFCAVLLEYLIVGSVFLLLSSLFLTRNSTHST